MAHRQPAPPARGFAAVKLWESSMAGTTISVMSKKQQKAKWSNMQPKEQRALWAELSVDQKKAVELVKK